MSEFNMSSWMKEQYLAEAGLDTPKAKKLAKEQASELIKTEKRIKKIQFIFIITGSLLLIFAVSLLIFNIRSKRKIETQKKLIERKRKKRINLKRTKLLRMILMILLQNSGRKMTN